MGTLGKYSRQANIASVPVNRHPLYGRIQAGQAPPRGSYDRRKKAPVRPVVLAFGSPPAFFTHP